MPIRRLGSLTIYALHFPVVSMPDVTSTRIKILKERCLKHAFPPVLCHASLMSIGLKVINCSPSDHSAYMPTMDVPAYHAYDDELFAAAAMLPTVAPCCCNAWLRPPAATVSRLRSCNPMLLICSTPGSRKPVDFNMALRTRRRSLLIATLGLSPEKGTRKRCQMPGHRDSG